MNDNDETVLPQFCTPFNTDKGNDLMMMTRWCTHTNHVSRLWITQATWFKQNYITNRFYEDRGIARLQKTSHVHKWFITSEIAKCLQKLTILKIFQLPGPLDFYLAISLEAEHFRNQLPRPLDFYPAMLVEVEHFRNQLPRPLDFYPAMLVECEHFSNQLPGTLDFYPATLLEVEHFRKQCSLTVYSALPFRPHQNFWNQTFLLVVFGSHPTYNDP